jgi:cell wall assembly regulator SMI1
MSFTENWIASVRDVTSQGATDEALDTAAATLGIDLPADYRAVMREVNGGEGAFGESWLRLHRVEDLVERNEVWREFQRPFTAFGSNGGGESYAWDCREGRAGNYATVSDIDLDPESAVPCGATFEEFLKVLHAGIPFELSGN